MACVEEEAWKCTKHPSKRRRTGICHLCLRDRLAVLCPHCANVRPCACLASTSSFDGGRPPKSFNRSMSAAIPFLRCGEQAPSDDLRLKTPSLLSVLRRRGSKTKRFDQEAEKDGNSRIDDFAKTVRRSRSVSADTTADSSPAKVKFWHFRSPMKVFWSPRATKAVDI